MRHLLFIVLIAFSPVLLASKPVKAEQKSVYDIALKSKLCSSKGLSCQYLIGKSLHINIEGIGNSDGGISFLKSDNEGDFYASFGLGHGCIIVKSNLNEDGIPVYEGYAFISPKNGNVYKDWMKCRDGK